MSGKRINRYERGRTNRIDGVRLPYALSELQARVARDAAIATGKPLAEVAQTMAAEFFTADGTADVILDYVHTRSSGWALERLQDMIDDGTITPLVLVSLLDVAVLDAVNARQSAAVKARKDRAGRGRAMHWLVDQWDRRAPGQFATRADFANWASDHCPVGIKADIERVATKWAPPGVAKQGGRLHIQK
jgi:hypothetical protein